MVDTTADTTFPDPVGGAAGRAVAERRADPAAGRLDALTLQHRARHHG